MATMSQHEETTTRRLLAHRTANFVFAGCVTLLASVFIVSCKRKSPEVTTKGCPSDSSGLKLPDGFCATVFADGIGHARHLAVGPNGVVYANTWSGDYYDFDKVHEGGFLVALQDKSGAGKADVIERFGETEKSGG